MSTSPPYLSIKEGVSSCLQAPVNSDDRSQVPFGMGPADIWATPTKRLPLIAKVVFVGLGIAAKGRGSVRTSHSVIAQLCGTSRATVVKGLALLVEAGLIERGEPVKQIERYTFLHPRLMAKSAGPIVEAGSKLVKREQPKCITCGKRRKALGPQGICRTCQHEDKIRRIAREEVAQQLKETA